MPLRNLQMIVQRTPSISACDMRKKTQVLSRVVAQAVMDGRGGDRRMRHADGHLVQRLDQVPGGVQSRHCGALVVIHEQLALVIAARSQPGGQLRLRGAAQHRVQRLEPRSEEHTSELQSLMRISYAVFCLKKKKN